MAGMQNLKVALTALGPFKNERVRNSGVDSQLDTAVRSQNDLHIRIIKSYKIGVLVMCFLILWSNK
jgi:hypothetical protein